mmetsp:Transcript_36822/g.47296  ORF Transcript_36822/g.47296 Transcript_36822/m.47296 type:complete len:150 (+) Transcript_36822:90-539(+)
MIMKIFHAIVAFLLLIVSSESVLLGGIHDVESGVEDAYVMSAVNEGMHELNAQRNGPLAFVALEVLEVNQQVVSGMKYTIVARIAPSSCPYVSGERLASYFASETCVADEGDAEIYQMQVWARPWLQEAPYQLMAADPVTKKGEDGKWI